MLTFIMQSVQMGHKKNERFWYSNEGLERQFCAVCLKQLEK